MPAEMVFNAGSVDYYMHLFQAKTKQKMVVKNSCVLFSENEEAIKLGLRISHAINKAELCRALSDAWCIGQWKQLLHKGFRSTIYTQMMSWLWFLSRGMEMYRWTEMTLLCCLTQYTATPCHMVFIINIPNGVKSVPGQCSPGLCADLKCERYT